MGWIFELWYGVKEAGLLTRFSFDPGQNYSGHLIRIWTNALEPI